MKQYAAASPPPDALPLSSGVLGGCGVNVSSLFSKEDSEIAREIVRMNGGKIVTPKDAVYLLAPLEGAGSKLEGVEKALVSMIWLVCIIISVSFWDKFSEIIHNRKDALKQDVFLTPPPTSCFSQ